MNHADDPRHIIYATWIIPHFFPYMRDLLYVPHWTLRDRLRLPFSIPPQKRAREAACARNICTRPLGCGLRAAEQQRLSLCDARGQPAQCFQGLWRGGHFYARQSGMERGVRRDDLLHLDHRLLLRGADDCADEGQPYCPAARPKLSGPQVPGQATAVVRVLRRRSEQLASVLLSYDYPPVRYLLASEVHILLFTTTFLVAMHVL
jgi:hypothetical protein